MKILIADDHQLIVDDLLDEGNSKVRLEGPRLLLNEINLQ